MLAGALLLLALFGAALVLFLRNRSIADKWMASINGILQNDFLYKLILVVNAGFGLSGVYYSAFLSKVTDAALSAYLLRLFPFVFWMTALAAHTLLCVRLWRYPLRQIQKEERRIFLWIGSISCSC